MTPMAQRPTTFGLATKKNDTTISSLLHHSQSVAVVNGTEKAMGFMSLPAELPKSRRFNLEQRQQSFPKVINQAQASKTDFKTSPMNSPQNLFTPK